MKPSEEKDIMIFKSFESRNGERRFTQNIRLYDHVTPSLIKKSK
jgi:hypothetical protein